ncbi:Esterase (modular protein) [Micrococcus sp. 116]|nr:Esterase (modular protein) [Micrococcus sp. 116]
MPAHRMVRLPYPGSMPRPVAVAPEDLPLRLMPAAPARRDHCVVLLHGFTSTPASVRAWAEGLAAGGSPVSVPLLPGHGTRWEDLAATGADEIRAAVRAVVDLELARHGRVVMAGISMGGALALDAAAHRPVAGVLVVNPALRFASPLAPFAAAGPVRPHGRPDRGRHRGPDGARARLPPHADGRRRRPRPHPAGRPPRPAADHRSRDGLPVRPRRRRARLEPPGPGAGPAPRPRGGGGTAPQPPRRHARLRPAAADRPRPERGRRHDDALSRAPDPTAPGCTVCVTRLTLTSVVPPTGRRNRPNARGVPCTRSASRTSPACPRRRTSRTSWNARPRSVPTTASSRWRTRRISGRTSPPGTPASACGPWPRGSSPPGSSPGRRSGSWPPPAWSGPWSTSPSGMQARSPCPCTRPPPSARCPGSSRTRTCAPS